MSRWHWAARGLQLSAAPDAAAMQRINNELESMFLAYVANALTDNKASTEKKRVAFANERLLSVTGEAHVWGGAHSSFSFHALTWDLATGERVDWSRRLHFTETKVVALEAECGCRRTALEVPRNEVRRARFGGGELP